MPWFGLENSGIERHTKRVVEISARTHITFSFLDLKEGRDQQLSGIHRPYNMHMVLLIVQWSGGGPWCQPSKKGTKHTPFNSLQCSSTTTRFA